MLARHPVVRDAAVGAVFFALATISILTTRFDGGLAHLWLANAFLITILNRRPRRRWAAPLLWASGAAILATGLFGLGWAMAPMMALANAAEALVATYFMRRAHSTLLAFGSPRWTFHLVWATGIAGPAAMGLVAMLPMWIHYGQPPGITLLRVIAGHGLANLTFIPVFKLFVTGNNGLWRQLKEKRSGVPIELLFVIQVAVTIAVFAQTWLPLLFLPILPVVAIVFKGGSRASAVSLLLLAAISGACTLVGRGPMDLDGTAKGFEIQFLQFYLLTTVMTVVPIAVRLRSRARLVRQVRDSEARYRMLADHSSDIITHTDLDGSLLFASASLKRLTGFDPRELDGSNLLDLVDPRDHNKVRDLYRASAQGQTEAICVEFRARTKSGKWRWFESWCRGVAGKDGHIESVVNIIRDISERKQREEQLSIAALSDPLTGLPNRRAFRDAARDEFSEMRPVATSIALLDIDHFKLVNDHFGHDAGDDVLTGFAAVAQQMLRREDMIARIGGEEFAIMFPGLGLHDAALACEQVRMAVASTAFPTAAGPVRITLSGGVSILGADGLDGALKRADGALYEAKSEGRDRLALAA